MTTDGLPAIPSIADQTTLLRIERKLDELADSLSSVARVQAVQEHRLNMLERQNVWLFAMLAMMGGLSVIVATVILFREMIV